MTGGQDTTTTTTNSTTTTTNSTDQHTTTTSSSSSNMHPLNQSTISFQDGWDKQIYPKAIQVLTKILDDGIDKQATKSFAPGTFMPIYTTCYNMCTQRSPYNFSEDLYTHHGLVIKSYLSSTVLPALKSKHDVFLLSELVSRWQNHVLMNKWMTRFFMYLDRYYVKHHSLPTLNDAGLSLFKSLVFDNIKADVVRAILAVIRTERDGNIVDKSQLRSVISVFEAMGGTSSSSNNNLDCYVNDFEVSFLSDSVVYYSAVATSWIESECTPSYLSKAEAALQSEVERVASYLHPSTEAKLIAAVQSQLLEKHEMELLTKDGSGVEYLLSNNKTSDLSRLFRLYVKVENNGLPPIASLVKSHISRMGNNIISSRKANIMEKEPSSSSDVATDKSFVISLLDLHEKYLTVINDQFAGHSLFQKALKEAFVEFVNIDVGKFTNAEMISTYVDRVLKTGGEKLSDQDVEVVLGKTVQLFSYLTDKDLFSAIYRNQLAKRLLNQRSASDDAERLMIGKLKTQCGAQFTSKFEGMLNDLGMAADHLEGFKTFRKSQEEAVRNGEAPLNLLEGETIDSRISTISGIPSSVDFTTQVLTTGHWPTYTTLTDVSLPPLFAKCTKLFEAYYGSKTSHRRLKWVHSLGNSTIKVQFENNVFRDLQVTTLQAITLLLFTQEDVLSFNDIRALLNVTEEITKRVLHSLSCGMYKILLKEGAKKKSISTSDVFTFNSKFVCPKRKIRIPMSSLEGSHNPKAVEDDRSIVIEAAIVRIMKARRMLGHTQLVAEVLSQLSFFKPDLKVIKRRIEALIDREYLERDATVTTNYKYLA